MHVPVPVLTEDPIFYLCLGPYSCKFHILHRTLESHTFHLLPLSEIFLGNFQNDLLMSLPHSHHTWNKISTLHVVVGSDRDEFYTYMLKVLHHLGWVAATEKNTGSQCKISHWHSSSCWLAVPHSCETTRTRSTKTHHATHNKIFSHFINIITNLTTRQQFLQTTFKHNELSVTSRVMDIFLLRFPMEKNE